MLNRLNISDVQKSFIELVLSFQHKDLEFYMEYSDIAELIGIKTQSVSNLVKKLKSNNFITTKKKSFHKNNKFIGSKSLIKVNEDYIIELITKTLTDTPNIVSNEVKVEEVIDTPIQVKEELKTEIVEDIKQKINESPSNNKKEALKEKFNEIFNSTDNLKLEHFHKLTSNKFKYTVPLELIKIMKGITKNDFETFYNRLQEAKPLIKN
jgi:DNA-binding Lrp family transcriptional regulator